MGTLERTGGGMNLMRCGGYQYELVDAPNESEKAVASLRERLPSLKPPVYAEVIGIYEERTDGGHRLNVLSIDGVTESKTCHLRDLLDALEAQENPKKQ